MLAEVNTHLTKENNQLKEEIEKLKSLIKKLRKGAILQMQNRHISTENVILKKISSYRQKVI